jgi:hypothetical protein
MVADENYVLPVAGLVENVSRSELSPGHWEELVPDESRPFRRWVAFRRMFRHGIAGARYVDIWYIHWL